MSSYNAATAEDARSTANRVVLSPVLPGFVEVLPDGSVVPDTDFGTFIKVSDSPLTVRYTFAERAVWSDGAPLDCDDAVMLWLANSGSSGASGWSSSDTAGYRDSGRPQCRDGERTFTVTYRKPYADWAAAYGSFLPAHVVERGSGVADLITAAATPTGPDSLRAAAFYNTAWKLGAGPVPLDRMPSAGPYLITAMDLPHSMTLSANPRWWGRPPRTRSIEVQFMDVRAMLQAMAAGRLDAIDPNPQLDVVRGLQSLGAAVRVTTSDQFTYEHLDFNFDGVFRNRDLRDAFARCVPRQQLVDTLITPQHQGAVVLQSRLALPFQRDYPSIVSGTDVSAYSSVDVPGATAAVRRSQVKAPIPVRLGWRKDPASPSPRRAQTVALIQASCRAAGFQVVDSGTPDFFEKGLPNRTFDIALFGWTNTPLVHEFADRYGSRGSLNFGHYTSSAADGLLVKLTQAVEPASRIDLLRKLDALLWKDLQSLPLFALPALTATGPGVQQVRPDPAPAGLAWNASEWSVTAG